MASLYVIHCIIFIGLFMNVQSFLNNPLNRPLLRSTITVKAATLTDSSVSKEVPTKVKSDKVVKTKLNRINGLIRWLKESRKPTPNLPILVEIAKDLHQSSIPEQVPLIYEKMKEIQRNQTLEAQQAAATRNKAAQLDNNTTKLLTSAVVDSTMSLLTIRSYIANKDVYKAFELYTALQQQNMTIFTAISKNILLEEFALANNLGLQIALSMREEMTSSQDEEAEAITLRADRAILRGLADYGFRHVVEGREMMDGSKRGSMQEEEEEESAARKLLSNDGLDDDDDNDDDDDSDDQEENSMMYSTIPMLYYTPIEAQELLEEITAYHLGQPRSQRQEATYYAAIPLMPSLVTAAIPVLFRMHCSFAGSYQYNRVWLELRYGKRFFATNNQQSQYAAAAAYYAAGAGAAAGQQAAGGVDGDYAAGQSEPERYQEFAQSLAAIFWYAEDYQQQAVLASNEQIVEAILEEILYVGDVNLLAYFVSYLLQPSSSLSSRKASLDGSLGGSVSSSIGLTSTMCNLLLKSYAMLGDCEHAYEMVMRYMLQQPTAAKAAKAAVYQLPTTSATWQYLLAAAQKTSRGRYYGKLVLDRLLLPPSKELSSSSSTSSKMMMMINQDVYRQMILQEIWNYAEKRRSTIIAYEQQQLVQKKKGGQRKTQQQRSYYDDDGDDEDEEDEVANSSSGSNSKAALEQQLLAHPMFTIIKQYSQLFPLTATTASAAPVLPSFQPDESLLLSIYQLLASLEDEKLALKIFEMQCQGERDRRRIISKVGRLPLNKAWRHDFILQFEYSAAQTTAQTAAVAAKEAGLQATAVLTAEQAAAQQQEDFLQALPLLLPPPSLAVTRRMILFLIQQRKKPLLAYKVLKAYLALSSYQQLKKANKEMTKETEKEKKKQAQQALLQEKRELLAKKQAQLQQQMSPYVISSSSPSSTVAAATSSSMQPAKQQPADQLQQQQSAAEQQQPSAASASSLTVHDRLQLAAIRDLFAMIIESIAFDLPDINSNGGQQQQTILSQVLAAVEELEAFTSLVSSPSIAANTAASASSGTAAGTTGEATSSPPPLPRRVYTALIHAFGRQGDIASALGVFQEYRMKMIPDTLALQSLLDVAVSSSSQNPYDLRNICGILQEMVQDDSLSMDIYSKDILMQVFPDAMPLAQALVKMEKQKFLPALTAAAKAAAAAGGIGGGNAAATPSIIYVSMEVLNILVQGLRKHEGLSAIEDALLYIGSLGIRLEEMMMSYFRIPDKYLKQEQRYQANPSLTPPRKKFRTMLDAESFHDLPWEMRPDVALPYRRQPHQAQSLQQGANKLLQKRNKEPYFESSQDPLEKHWLLLLKLAKTSNLQALLAGETLLSTVNSLSNQNSSKDGKNRKKKKGGGSNKSLSVAEEDALMERHWLASQEQEIDQLLTDDSLASMVAQQLQRLRRDAMETSPMAETLRQQYKQQQKVWQQKSATGGGTNNQAGNNNKQQQQQASAAAKAMSAGDISANMNAKEMRKSIQNLQEEDAGLEQTLMKIKNKARVSNQQLAGLYSSRKAAYAASTGSGGGGDTATTATWQSSKSKVNDDEAAIDKRGGEEENNEDNNNAVKKRVWQPKSATPSTIE